MPTVVAEHLTTCMVVIVFCRGFSHAVDCACRCTMFVLQYIIIGI